MVEIASITHFTPEVGRASNWNFLRSTGVQTSFKSRCFQLLFQKLNLFLFSTKAALYFYNNNGCHCSDCFKGLVTILPQWLCSLSEAKTYGPSTTRPTTLLFRTIPWSIRLITSAVSLSWFTRTGNESLWLNTTVLSPSHIGVRLVLILWSPWICVTFTKYSENEWN